MQIGMKDAAALLSVCLLCTIVYHKTRSTFLIKYFKGLLAKFQLFQLNFKFATVC